MDWIDGLGLTGAVCVVGLVGLAITAPWAVLNWLRYRAAANALAQATADLAEVLRQAAAVRAKLRQMSREAQLYTETPPKEGGPRWP